MKPQRRHKSGKPGKPKNIRNYVVWLLGRREHSEHELRKRLAQRGCEPHEIDDAITFVKSYGYQSDQRYASMKARVEARRHGNRRVQFALASKGVAKDEIEEQISALAPESDRAIAAVNRFEGQVLDQKLKQKVWRFLGSRAFSSSAIRAAIDHLQAVLAQADSADPTQ
jgi:regulatory protein